jgi:minor curlin subunit
MRINYLVVAVVSLNALMAVDAQAGNSVSVLQFGTTNLSFTSQSGPTNSNTATTLQFGATNKATSLQWGRSRQPIR